MDWEAITIDLSASKASLLPKLKSACVEYGFFLLKWNFSARHRLLEEAMNFFDLPEEVKVQSEDYIQLCKEIPYEKGVVSFVESITKQNNDVLSSTWATPSLEEAGKNAYRELSELALQLYDLLSEAFEFEKDFLRSRCEKFENGQFRLLHYPKKPQGETFQVGIGAHTDFELLTLLSQRGPRVL